MLSQASGNPAGSGQIDSIQTLRSLLKTRRSGPWPGLDRVGNALSFRRSASRASETRDQNLESEPETSSSVNFGSAKPESTNASHERARLAAYSSCRPGFG